MNMFLVFNKMQSDIVQEVAKNPIKSEPGSANLRYQASATGNSLSI